MRGRHYKYIQTEYYDNHYLPYYQLLLLLL